MHKKNGNGYIIEGLIKNDVSVKHGNSMRKNLLKKFSKYALMKVSHKSVHYVMIQAVI